MLIRGLFRTLMETPSAPDAGGGGSSTSSSASSSTESSSASSEGSFDFADLALSGGSEGGNASPPSAPAGSGTPASTPASASPPAAGAAPAAPAPPAQPPQAASPAGALPAGTAPAAPPAQAAPPQGQQPAQPAAPAAPQGQQPQPPATEGQPPQTQEQMNAAFDAHRKQFLPQLEKLYDFSSDAEMVDLLRTAPDKALPKLAAQLHYEVQMGAVNAVMSMMPQLVGNIITQRRSSDEAESQFRKDFPKLFEKAEYSAAVTNSIRAARNAAPNASIAEVMKAAGTLAMITLGLPLEMPGAAAAVPAAPAAPAMPPPGRPAGIGGSGAGPGIGMPGARPPAEGEGNVFAELVEYAMSGG